MPCTRFHPTEGPPSGGEGVCRGPLPIRGRSPSGDPSCFSRCGWCGPRHCQHVGGGGALATSLRSDQGTSSLRIAPPQLLCGLEKVMSFIFASVLSAGVEGDPCPCRAHSSGMGAETGGAGTRGDPCTNSPSLGGAPLPWPGPCGWLCAAQGRQDTVRDSRGTETHQRNDRRPEPAARPPRSWLPGAQ